MEDRGKTSDAHWISMIFKKKKKEKKLQKTNTPTKLVFDTSFFGKKNTFLLFCLKESRNKLMKSINQ